MTEGNWDAREASAEFVDVPLGGVWTAADGERYRCVGGGCGRCAFLRPPIRVGKTGVETTCANQLDADLNGGPRLACFPFERRDAVGVRFERVEEPVPTANAATKLGESFAWLRERWNEEPADVVLAVAALVWLALVAAKVFG